MITVCYGSDYLFRVPSDKQGGEKPELVVEDQTLENALDGEEYILCRTCRHIITSPAERIEVQGSHRHTFANPQGIVYEIGCFRTAAGCGYVGPSTGEFTWFKGYSWRIAACSRCLTHLGWLYISNALPSFNGLILDHLIDA